MGSYNQYAAVTPSDTINGPFTPDTPTQNLFYALYVGGAGNIALVDQSDNVTLFAAVPVGTVLTVSGKRVNSTNTTATNLVALRSV